MSRENIELVERVVEAFNRRDPEALAEFVHDDFEFVSVLTAVEAGGATYRGRDGWIAYFNALDDTWDDWHVDEVDIRDVDDERLAAVFRLGGTGRRSGARATQTIGITYAFRDGKVWRMRSYLDPADALAAVGLSY